MSREIMQQALTALRISTPFAHALEYYEFRNKAIKDIEAELAKPEQEPVAWMGSAGLGYEKNKYLAIPLYTSPPRKPWVGLTDEQMFEIIDRNDAYLDMCREVEAKLKEKNT